MAALVALAAGLASCSSGDSGAQPEKRKGSEAARADAGALAGQSLYVDPSTAAASQADRWKLQGRARDAAAMRRLAGRPTALWIADDVRVGPRVRAYTRRASAAGETALLVAYYLPGRDCGSYSAGGASSAAGYRAWVRAYAAAIGDRRAVVILEPDGIPHAVQGCISKRARAERYALLRFAVRTLEARPRVHVYIDAGNPGFVRPGSRLVGPLRRSGIGDAAGFALNVSNFYRTASVNRYGRDLSRRLGGAHFVVDTSRNGNGPSPADDPGGPKWCNPPGRAVGRAPTTETGEPLVDAYLWVKAPGESDGSCRAGAPPAGQWWPDYALSLVR